MLFRSYFNTRYPGDESITINKEDLKECMEAVAACRKAVIEYLKERYIEKEDDLSCEELLREKRSRTRGR